MDSTNIKFELLNIVKIKLMVVYYFLQFVSQKKILIKFNNIIRIIRRAEISINTLSIQAKFLLIY